AAGPCQAGDQPGRDRVAGGGEDDGNGGGRALGGNRRVTTARQDDVHGRLDQLSREPGQPLRLVFGPAEVDCHVLALEVAEILQRLQERPVLGQGRRRGGRQESDPGRLRSARGGR